MYVEKEIMSQKIIGKSYQIIINILYRRNASKLTIDTTFTEDLKGPFIQMVGYISEIENELQEMVVLQDAASLCYF